MGGIEFTPDDNDLIYDTYGVDFFGILRYFYEALTGSNWDALVSTVLHWWNIYSIFALFLSLLFFAGFIYSKIRYSQLSEIEHHKIHEAEKAWARRYEGVGTRSARWDVIQKRAGEPNPESWRVAIIEADILLDETLSKAGYVGKSLGEKLKSANPSSFTTIQDAWEAHKVRNDIAHVGSDFVLTQRVAKETLLRFERVFREFSVI
ncbi:MAG: hypothetical protein NUW00_00020 [Candidatus Kaiserbacteria bacterium]|nr:hypothetical protein [Candidatus Kaiserbacteria bacterium]